MRPGAIIETLRVNGYPLSLATSATMSVRVGQLPRHVGLAEPDDSFLVHYNDGPVARPAFLVPKVIGPGGLSLGMEVGKLRVGQPAHGGAPSLVGMYCIATDAQNLGIVLLKPAVSLPEEGGLAGSTSGEIKDVEGKHHRLVAAILAQGNISVLWRGQLEIRGYIANFSRHNLTPLDWGGVQSHCRRDDYTPQQDSLLSPFPLFGGVILLQWLT